MPRVSFPLTTYHVGDLGCSYIPRRFALYYFISFISFLKPWLPSNFVAANESQLLLESLIYSILSINVEIRGF